MTFEEETLLKAEIIQLKELLKEYRRRFKLYKETESSREYILYDLEFLTTEIDNAIGEKKNGTTN